MALIGNIEPYLPGGNFLAYEDRVQQFFLVNNVKEEKKTPLFITIAGPNVYDILMSLTVPKLPSTMKFEELIKLLRTHYTPKVNKRTERYKFHKAVQEIGETVSEFVVRLKSLLQTCKFDDVVDSGVAGVSEMRQKILDEVLVDRFIMGIRNEKIQQVLLNDESLTFEQCVNKALNMELIDKESKSIHTKVQNAVSFTSQKKFVHKNKSDVTNQRNRQWNNNHRSKSGGNNNRLLNKCKRFVRDH